MAGIYQRLYPLIKSILILLLIFLVVGGLYYARMFLIPLAFAGILAMLMIPLSQKMESKGINRPAATFICIAILLLFFIALAALLSTQITSFAQDYPALENHVRSRLADLRQFVQENFGISPTEAVGGDSSGAGIGSTVFSFLGSFTSILAHSLLALVYLFMLMNYRSHFSKFILKVVPDDQKEKAKSILRDSSVIAEQYLVGRGLLIIILGFMYTVGLMIVGIHHAILFSVLAALLSIIPYIGNILGVAFPLLTAVVQGGGLWLFIGIIIVFSIAQFIESYFLEPYVVGAEVNIHPFFTIVAIIAGELVWGIAGMILSIPLLAILKIIMENIEPLKPYAFLIGDSDEDNFMSFKKLKERFKRNNE